MEEAVVAAENVPQYSRSNAPVKFSASVAEAQQLQLLTMKQ
jgi:hypothetical protein